MNKFYLDNLPSSTLKDSGMSDKTNDIFLAGNVGSITDAISNNFYGINHRQTPAAIQRNKDYYGLTFFTRPQMNLTWDNVKDVRQLAPLLTNEEKSIQRIIRCTLDPKLMDGHLVDEHLNGIAHAKNILKCPIIDNRQAFIPLLTNNLLSISGWPDVTAPTYTSQPGAYQEIFGFIDGITKNYGTYDIHANFRNIPGDPITLLFLVWIHYASSVFEGIMVPYPEKIINNEVDYNTRIYRLVLDTTKRFVKKIAACGAGHPVTSPIGNAFSYESDRPIDISNDQISIPIRCYGACYQDDILIREFNQTAYMFNPLLDPSNSNRKNVYMKIPPNALGIFNNKGYPLINEETYELEWWIEITEFQPIYNKYNPLSNKDIADMGGDEMASLLNMQNNPISSLPGSSGNLIDTAKKLAGF